MKMICINNYANLDGPRYFTSLTLGKIYTILNEDEYNSSFYEIINDNNEISSLYKSRFISIKEYRKLKLEKICKK